MITARNYRRRRPSFCVVTIVKTECPLCAKSRPMKCSINCNDEGPEHRTTERPSSAWRFPRGRVLCHGVQNRPIKGREFIFQPAAECLDLRAIAAALRTHEVVGAARGQSERNRNHQPATA